MRSALPRSQISRIGDLFLLRNCPTALQKLFNAQLRLLMDDGCEIDLTVKFNVGAFVPGQLSVHSKLQQALTKRRQTLHTVDKLPKVLDLSALAGDAELAELVIHLGSTSCVSVLNVLIKRMHAQLFGGVRGLLLSNNRLDRLSTFRQWPHTYVHLLDISDNNVSSVYLRSCVAFFGEYAISICRSRMFSNCGTWRESSLSS